jgi:phosphoglycerate dehydrogenase-like enzyme
LAKPVLIIGSPVENFDAHALAARLAPQFPTLELRASDDPATALPLAPGARVMMGFGHNFSEALLAAEPGVEWIQTLTAGTDAVFALKNLPRNTRVTSMAGVQGPQMAEMAFLHMLTLVRQYPRVLDNQRAHRWERWPQAVLFGKTVVIVGVGGIATVLARRCKAFDMHVIGVSTSPREVEGFDRVMPRTQLAEAAALADFLVVLVPLAPATRHIIDARILASMKRSAFLINIARGGVVDEQALLDALKNKRIAGAGLDVFEVEPLPTDSPLWDAPGLEITAHVGGMSEIYNQQMVPVVERNLRCYAEGRFDDMVNVVRG